MALQPNETLIYPGGLQTLSNCFLAPGFEPLKLFKELKEQMNASMGSIDPTYLYGTDRGAEGWCNVSNQEDYLAAKNSMSMEDIADAILYRLSKTQLKQDSLDILALGSGEARDERRLVQILRKKSRIQDIRLVLLDISTPLIASAYHVSQQLFSSDPGVQVYGFQGNFYHLQRYQELLSIFSQTNRMLLVTMLGLTWSNLPNETDFLRHSLGSLPKNAFLLLDMALRYTDSNDPAAITKVDPWLSGDSKWWKREEEFLAAPILSYRKGVTPEQIKFITVLDNFTAHIPNSYVVEMRALLADGAQFTMQRFKRYELKTAIDLFTQEHWQLIRSFAYNEEHFAACFFQRKL